MAHAPLEECRVEWLLCACACENGDYDSHCLTRNLSHIPICCCRPCSIYSTDHSHLTVYGDRYTFFHLLPLASSLVCLSCVSWARSNLSYLIILPLSCERRESSYWTLRDREDDNPRFISPVSRGHTPIPVSERIHRVWSQDRWIPHTSSHTLGDHGVINWKWCSHILIHLYSGMCYRLSMAFSPVNHLHSLISPKVPDNRSSANIRTSMSVILLCISPYRVRSWKNTRIFIVLDSRSNRTKERITLSLACFDRDTVPEPYLSPDAPHGEKSWMEACDSPRHHSRYTHSHNWFLSMIFLFMDASLADSHISNDCDVPARCSSENPISLRDIPHVQCTHILISRCEKEYEWKKRNGRIWVWKTEKFAGGFSYSPKVMSVRTRTIQRAICENYK